MRRDLRGVSNVQQFEEIAAKLHEMIGRAPGMRRARRHGEAERLVKGARLVEVAHRQHEMIDAPCHDASVPEARRTRQGPRAPR